MLADRLHKTPVELHFSRPVLSSDNAVGIAALAAEEEAFNGRTAMSIGT
jgi:tRNA A37 threonylcarbamoyltransferase TsaD